MKKLFKFLVFLVFFAIFLVAVAIFMIPKDKIKAEIVAAVEKETGRSLSFDDNVGLTFFPDIGITLKDVQFSNAEWATHKTMLKVGSLDVALAFKPLLQKRVEMKRFVLESPEINLEVNKDGRANWEFKTSDNKDNKKDDTKSKGTPQDLEITLGKFVIENAKLSYIDQTSDTKEVLGDVDVTLGLPTLESDLTAKGGLTYKGERIALDAKVSTLKSIMDQKPATVTAKASMLGTDFGYVGSLNISGDPMLKGKFDLSVGSITRLMKFASPDSDQGNQAIDSFTASFNGEIGSTKVTYKGLDFKSDKMNIQGEGVIDWGKTVPYIQGAYNISKLNINQFMTEEAAPTKEKPKKGESVDISKGWDTRPYDFSGLKAINADLTANVAGYVYDTLEMGANTLTLKLNNGKLNMGVSDTALFDGIVSSDFELDSSKSVPSIITKAKLSKLNAQKLAGYLADTDKLLGTMNGSLNVTMSGKSQKDMIASMAGTTDLMFRDGEIRGVSMVDWANAFQKRLSNVGDTQGSTKFVELGGSFNILKGIASNKDFKLVGPLVEAAGAGIVDMPNRALDYGLKIKLLENETLTMPFKIKGPWQAVKVRPDLESVLKNVIADPEKNLKDLKNVGKKIEDSFEKDKDAIKNQVKDLENLKDNVKDFKNLLKGF
jgi:AsmA protein